MTKTTIKAFGQIKVACHKHEPDLRLVFTDRTVFEDALRAIKKKYTVNDSFWGFAVYGTVADALGTCDMWAAKKGEESK